MTGSVPDEAVAGVFEEQRERLVAVAYRMLGSRADAEDAVQEAWLRLARHDAAAIDNLGGWLTTVVARVCIDALRSRKVRPEVSYDDQLPELIVTEDGAGAPEDDALLAESVGLALLVVLETLRPTERLAFVLHDMFAVPFDEIGQIIDKSSDATKMLASRARRKVQNQRSSEERRQHRTVVDAFFAAARSGDFEGLLRLLDPDVRLRSHTVRGVVVRLGAAEVAGRARRGATAVATSRQVLVNGEPGVVAWGSNGNPVGLMVCTVVDGRIVEMMSIHDPESLAALDLPERPD